MTKLALGTIFTAYSLLVSQLVTLYTLAKPPLPNILPRMYLCTVKPSPHGRFLCSIIVIGSAFLSFDEDPADAAAAFLNPVFNGLLAAPGPASAAVELASPLF